MARTLVRLVDGALQILGLAHKLATNVNVRRFRFHGKARDEAALHQLVGVVSHDLAVLACARLALVRIDHQIARSEGYKKINTKNTLSAY